MTSRRSDRRKLPWLVGVLFIAAGPLHSAPIPTVSRVIHVSVDGLAAVYLREAMTSAPAEFPTFWRLITNGASTFNARCDYDYSLTLPNHSSMFTGRPVLQPAGMPETTHHGHVINSDDDGTLHDWNPAVAYQASVFDVAHDHGLKTALLASKLKFGYYARTWNAEHGTPDVTGEDNGRNKIDFAQFTNGDTNPPIYTASEPLVNSVLNGLTNSGWNYVFLHFSETDATGHVYGFGSAFWSNAVRHVDLQLGRILSTIRNSPALANTTALIVSSDHGGQPNGDHGFPEVLSTYTIPFFLWCPGIPKGADLYALLANRKDPGASRIDYVFPDQPLWNGDGGNLAMTLLGLPPIPGSMLRPELEIPAFQLTIRAAAGSVTVLWPVEAHDYTLEGADSCLPEADWQAITTGINRVGTQYVYSTPADSAARFFRLRK